jgi:TRAP transporter TAXI family solute receptor
MAVALSAIYWGGAASAQTETSKTGAPAQSTAGSQEPFLLAEAQTRGDASAPARDKFVEELNANTVTIISGNPNGSYLYLAYDMAAVLDDPAGVSLRVLPVVGRGGGQNTKDVLYLRGIDMGITQSVILRYFNKTGEVGRNISNRLRYIARLYNEEMHLLVAPNINSIEDLKGKKVNFSDVGSGSQISSQLIFEDLKIPVQEVNIGQADAFEALKKGEIAATVLIAGKPAGAFAKLKAGPDYKLIPVPYLPALQENYLPATLTHEDYPTLIPEGEQVNTIAASAVLACFNWPANSERYRRVAKFTEAFFQNFDKFLEKPRHPKWKEVNLAATLSGWERFGAAQEILDRNKTATASQSSQLKKDFDQFLVNSAESKTNMTPERRNELFRDFMKWHNARTGQ